MLLVPAVTKEHGIEPEVLLRAGHQRSRVAVRAMIVYLGREWEKTEEMARQSQRGPAVISGLYDQYRSKRELKTEARVLQVFQK